MTENEFEEYARRTLYLMFLMIKKDYYKILNPKKANLKGLELYLQNILLILKIAYLKKIHVKSIL